MPAKSSRTRDDSTPDSTSAGGQPTGRNRRSKPGRDAAASGTLTLVATPIGNLRDIGLRALDVLASADLIACEDTRETRRLLGAHGIKPPKLIACHDHNEAETAGRVVARLRAGDSVCLVSDAGMPTISDPGHRVVRAVRDAELPVTAVPGANAALVALALSGLPSDRFLFAGFPPRKPRQRRAFLAELAAAPAALVFHEAPGRLPDSLADMAEALGPRDAAVARELTKLFEEVRRAPLLELARHYAEAGPPKGELVVVVGPPDRVEGEDPENIDAALVEALGAMRVKDAANTVAGRFGTGRRATYRRALALSKRGRGEA